MSDAHAARRVAWVAASLDTFRRPAVLAEWVRAHGMAPPPSDGSPELPALGDREARAREVLRVCAAQAWPVLTPDDAGWQQRFWDEMPDPPATLFIRGVPHGTGDPAVAIVGSRHPSDAGRAIAFRIARDLASWGVTVVSGLAMGIDAAAHRGALEAAGHTVAVLGSGVDRIAPACNRELGERVAETGALVSEFPLGCGPHRLHFPRRNRILAAMAEVVLLVEGDRYSGARSTVEHAIALGREVAAVPRDPVHSGAELPDALIRSGSAAVTSARDVLDLLRNGDRIVLSAAAPRPDRDGRARALTARANGTIEGSILDRLRRGIRSYESLRSEGICLPEDLLAILGRLESLGVVRRMPGMRFELAEDLP